MRVVIIENNASNPITESVLVIVFNP
jgi:hypothetical protein